MPRPPYLTKSRYSLALECPRKLFYTAKPEFANNKSEDAFLMALADSGVQVGELAKCYFPDGIEVRSLDSDSALQETRDLLEQHGDVTLFEAALGFQDCLVRVDVLQRTGNRVELIEVKAKSWSPGEDLCKRDGLPASGWASYLHDVAFQQWVVSNTLPSCTVSPYLMVVRKDAVAPTSELNQKFRIGQSPRGRSFVTVSADLSERDLQPSILHRLDVGEVVRAIQAATPGPAGFDCGFAEEVELLARAYREDTPLPTTVGAKCRGCEFHCNEVQLAEGALRDGRRDCWLEMTNLGAGPFEQETVLDLWNFRRADRLIQEGKIRLTDLEDEDLGPDNGRSNGESGLSRSGRQQVQWRQALGEEEGDYLDRDGIAAEITRWRYPLHFIDFETSAEAIPFHRGCSPYDPVIFQISHHVMHDDGRVEHRGEFLDDEPGHYPSFDAVRWLRRELSEDDGTIFRYSHHENTCLVAVHRMLHRFEDEIGDATELREFIENISHSTSGSIATWTGDRDMLDLCALCERFYVPVSAQGSTSLKYILPAILNGSRYLQDKYRNPIYGSSGPAGIPSRNFTDQAWVRFDSGRVRDPYELLPPMFEDFTEEQLENLNVDAAEQISEGGAAMMAYRRLQLTDVDGRVRESIRRALLKYCELDTLAMVMLVEGWLGAVNSGP